MVWIVCQDSDNKVFYENPDSGEMTRKKPREHFETEEKQEKEHLEEYQILTNEIDGKKKNISAAKQNIKEAQQTIHKEKHDIEKLHRQLKLLDVMWKPNGRIEELPAEILMHIFRQLFDLKSISNCYNTNLRWKTIVEVVFKNSNSKFSF